MDCVFCKIIKREMPAEIIYEDGKIIVFNNIDPKAAVHLLVVPKKHISSINHIEDEDRELIGEMFIISKKVAKDKKIAETGYRLIFNIGKDAGQTVDHLHLHLMGGEKLIWA